LTSPTNSSLNYIGSLMCPTVSNSVTNCNFTHSGWLQHNAQQCEGISVLYCSTGIINV